MKAYYLQTEYRTNPLGIDEYNPLLRWKCTGGVRQTAYRICVWDEADTILFDTGKAAGGQMHCRYHGEPLHSMQRLYWNVTLWDENDVDTVSETAWFETGLSPEDWKAKWICGVDTGKKERLPADCYRRKFVLSELPEKARLYATAHGVYAASVNGQRLPGVLAPGCTEYDRRLYYQTYDVTDLLRAGENILDITVGDGWYKGKVGSSNIQYFSGDQTALLAQLVLTDSHGNRECIGTDETFLWCNDGPILYTDLKDGEIYDARKTPGYGSTAGLLECRQLPSASPIDLIEEHECFVPELLISPSGAKILDFGQNIAGYIRFTVSGQPGQRIRLRMCEALDHGEFSDATVRQTLPDQPPANQEIIFICKGGEEEFRPEFFYSGFRYALAEGLEEVKPENFQAVAVYTEMTFTGEFSCSNTMINRFFNNTRWSMKSNFVDIPTDCPQREKSGWTGDAQVFVKTASYLADTAAFYRKWLRDVRDCQREDGRVDNVCPKIRGMEARDVLNGSVGWADAAVIIPYTLWKLYRDDTFIRENYDLLHGWKEYVIKAASDKSLYRLPDDNPLKSVIAPFLLPDSEYNKYIIESGLHWGEWCEPDVDGGTELVHPKQEITAAYMHYSMTLLSEMLRATDREEEAKQCDEYAKGARKAYNYHFVRDGQIQAPRQAPMVRALALGLLEEEDRKSVAKQLNQDAIRRKYTVGTGFLSTPFVLRELARSGYVDTAYKMLENTAAPGWLSMVAQGATTVWENCVSYDEDGHPLVHSMNHYSPGAVCNFLFETVCGISVDEENHFSIKPVPGGTLTWAKAVYDSPYGKVSSGWEKDESGFTFRFTIPSNTTARVCLPDGTQHDLTAGEYCFRVCPVAQ